MTFNAGDPSNALTNYSRQVSRAVVPFHLGVNVGDQSPFLLTPEQISVHMAILGGSGSGKSKFMELLLRQYMIDGQSFFFFDPHGDTAKDLLAFAAARAHPSVNDGMWRKIHYLKVGPDSAFSYDPFAHAPRRKSKNDVFYKSWLDTKVQFLCRAILRRFAQSDVDAMNRMLRWMENVLYFCGTAYDGNNSHNGFDKLLIATNPDHPEFEPMLQRVFPFLHDYVQQDFIALNALNGPQRVQTREKWIESTINNLRRIVSTLLLEVFAQRAPSINIPEIMREGGFIIADLGETGNWGHAQKTMLGGLLIQEVLHAKYVQSELLKEDRRPFTLAIDEVGEFLGDDLERALGATRKYNLPIILAAQDLSTFAKGDFDMAAKVLSMCGTVVCFQNTFKDDKEILIDRIGTGNLDFTPEVVEVQRQRRLLKIMTRDVSESEGGSENWNEGWNITDSSSFARAVGQSITLTNNWSNNSSDSEGVGEGFDTSEAEIEKDGTKASKSKSKGIKKSRNRAHVEGRTDGGGDAHANNTSETNTVAQAKGKSGGKGGGTNWGKSFTEKETFITPIETEWEENGRLAAGPIADQKEKMMQQLHLLAVRLAIVASRSSPRAFVARIGEVQEWWDDSGDKMAAIRKIREALNKLRPYQFSPGSDDDDALSDDEAGREIVAEAPTRPERMKLKEPAQKHDPFGK